MVPEANVNSVAISYDELLRHWLGHRLLTRRVLEAFPDDEFFQFTVGGMRPCSALALEMISMTAAGIRGLATRKWTMVDDLAHHAKAPAPRTKAEMLRRWDEVTDEINTLWPKIAPHRFEEIDVAFGQYEGRVFGLFLYWIDNEPSPGPGLRLSARVGHRTAAVLRARLIDE